MVRVACFWALLLSLCLVGCSSPASTAAAAPPAVTGVVQPALSEPVRLWQDAGIFNLVGGLIGSARRRALVEMYELGRRDIVNALGAAAARGVAVRVITDPTVT
ncbi:MAG: phospholipase D-like domain-containing protein, partial [Candidatus Dormiibacterota bacterium]